LTYNPDGSLPFYVQKEPPSEREHRLLKPKADFSLFLRAH